MNGSQPPVEVGAVADHVRLDPAVREAARPERHVERELHRVARLERPLERVDPVADLRVREHGLRRAVERHRARLDVADRAYTCTESIGAPVWFTQPVRAAQVDGRLVGIDLDAQLRARDDRLRQVLVPLVAPLVLGLRRSRLLRRAVRVQDVRVVEDEAAEREDQRDRHAGRARDRAGEARARLARAGVAARARGRAPRTGIATTPSSSAHAAQ